MQVDRGVAVRQPGVVIIKTLVLPLDSRPSDTRYSQTPIRLPMRSILRLRDVTVHLLGSVCLAVTSGVDLVRRCSSSGGVTGPLSKVTRGVMNPCRQHGYSHG